MQEMWLTHSPENAFNWNVSDRVVWRRNLYHDRWCRYEHWLNLFIEFLSTYVHKTFLRLRTISINMPSECDPSGTLLQRSEQMQFLKRQTTARLLRCQNVWLAPETPVTWIVNLHVKVWRGSLTIDSLMQTVHSLFGNAPKNGWCNNASLFDHVWTRGRRDRRWCPWNWTETGSQK